MADDLARRIAERIVEATDIDRDAWRTETTAMAEIIRTELAPLLAAEDRVIAAIDRMHEPGAENAWADMALALDALRAAREGRP